MVGPIRLEPIEGTSGMSSPKARKSTGVSATELTNCIRRFYNRGWCDGTAGNFSVLLEHKPVRILMTRTGIDKGRIENDDLVEVDGEGKTVIEGSPLPSSEASLHCTLYRETDAQAILHTHSLWGTLLSERYQDERGVTISGYEMIKGIAGIQSHREPLFIPILKNTQDLRQMSDGLARMLRRRAGMRSFLISGHGLYTWGTTLEEAYRHVEVFEFLFRLVGHRDHLDRPD